MENAKCYAPQILVGTEGLPREQWLEYRRKGIGGSDAAAVLGISPFRTGRDLYYDKLNIVTADDAENWVQLEVGTLLEPLVAKIFAHKTGYQRRPHPGGTAADHCGVSYAVLICFLYISRGGCRFSVSSPLLAHKDVI